MPMSGLDSGSVKDEDDQREPNYTRCCCARVSEYVFESVGHLIVAMLEFGDFARDFSLTSSTKQSCVKRLLRLAHLIRCDQGPQGLAKIQMQSAFLLAVIFYAALSICAQSPRALVTVQVSPPDLVKISIRPRQPLRNWSFINSYASTLGLGDRVQNLRVDSTSPV